MKLIAIKERVSAGLCTRRLILSLGLVLLSLLGCQKADSYPPAAQHSAVNKANPLTTWASFTFALENENLKNLELLTSPECLAFTKNRTKSDQGYLMKGMGEKWTKSDVVWEKWNDDEAIALIGPKEMPNQVKFKNTASGWVVSKWSPAW